MGAVISHNNTLIGLLLRSLIKPQRNNTATEKELIAIVECLKQFCRTRFGYKINIFSCHKHLVYATTLSESQNFMRWRLIIEDFGTNIQHI